MSTVKQSTSLDSQSNQPPGEVCIPNISTAERRKRLTGGLIIFAASLVILAILVMTGANRLWRLPLFFLFLGGASGYFQWRDKTCVGLSSRNSRKLGEIMEKIEDPAELAQVQRQARQVQLKAFIAAIPLTVIALLLPVLV
jgi:hypothetical protein